MQLPTLLTFAAMLLTPATALWEVAAYSGAGCTGTATGQSANSDGVEFYCGSADGGYHNFNTVIEDAGMKVWLYSDENCGDLVAEIRTDGCSVTPELVGFDIPLNRWWYADEWAKVPITAYSVVRLDQGEKRNAVEWSG